jgi:hypothetical protein
MQFVWDKEEQSPRNFAKQKISFETARPVSEDPLHISHPELVLEVEERRQTMRLIGAVAVVLGARTLSEEDDDAVIRIITARKTTSHVRRQYEQNRQQAGKGTA